MENLIAFYHALPGELLTLVAVFLGTTGRALVNRKTGAAVGLVTIVVNASIGYGVIWLTDRRDIATMKEIWWLGVLAGFLASYILGGLETAGQQFEKKPIPMLISWFVELWDQVYTRWMAHKSKEK